MKKDIVHPKTNISITSAVLIGAGGGAVVGSIFGFTGGIVGIFIGILLMIIIKFSNKQ
jgi:hypothetical protein